jgi:uncharacterized BrkB/YihY/UPF0761 family membrane protein
MGSMARRKFQFIQQRQWSLVLFISYILAMIACICPLVIFYGVVMYTLEFQSSDDIHIGPSLYAWLIAAIFHAAGLPLAFLALKRRGSVLKTKFSNDDE